MGTIQTKEVKSENEDLSKWEKSLSAAETSLPKLMANNFCEYENISSEEKELLNSLLSYKKSSQDDRFNLDFLQVFWELLAIEDLEETKQFESYNIESAKVSKYSSCGTDINEKILEAVIGKDHMEYFRSNGFIIQSDSDIELNFTSVEIDGIEISNKTTEESFRSEFLGSLDRKIFVTISSKNIELKSSSYKIFFAPKRATVAITQRALVNMKARELNSYLVNFELGENEMPLMSSFWSFSLSSLIECMNPSISENKEQMTAVENIFDKTSYPSPFVIFGGPGTGKTSTVVESIVQIAKLKPNSRVLVTAASNAACDEIGKRLLKYMSAKDVLRIYSKTYLKKKAGNIDKDLMKVSNFRGTEIQKHEFWTARVVIVTATSSGSVRAKVCMKHFDYIFIDEAGSISEPGSYIPLSKFAFTQSKPTAQIVLSGDHKQLRCVVKNGFAKDMGLDVSLMERLMNYDAKYQRQNDDEYDNKYVVQLKKNYRSHPAILRYSNESFYNSKLTPECPKEVRDFAIGDKTLLKNPDFPILFHASYNPSEKVNSSQKNEGELKLIMHYLKQLLTNGVGNENVKESDIGVIVTYSAQRDRAIEEINQLYPNVEVGTVDIFQGREKKVILMSCVRSGGWKVGFLRDEKRLNVALTRAKSLLIIVGNTYTLQSGSKAWRNFIRYCRKNNAIVNEQIRPKKKRNNNARQNHTIW